MLGTLTLLAGLALRVAVWAQSRSAYMDEIALLRNLLERDFAGLFRPLAYLQYAPPLFSVLAKASVVALGASERAMRLVPVLSSMAALVVLAGLARRWLRPGPAVLAVAWVGLSAVYLEYGTVCKQYATDGFVALALLGAAEWQNRYDRLSGRATAGWAVGGAVAVWAAMPAVFVLAGVGLWLAWRYQNQLRAGTPDPWLHLLAIGGAWAGSFGLYFALLLKADAESSYLQQFHHDAFLMAWPRSGTDWALLANQLLGILDKSIGKTVLAQALGAVGFVVGAGALIRREPGRALLLLLPIAACLMASALHYYSLIIRLLLFMLPLVVLVMVRGLQTLLTLRWRAAQATVWLAALLVLANQQRLVHLWRPLQGDWADVRAGLRHVAARQQPGDRLVIYHLLEPLYVYYARLHPQPLHLPPVVIGQYREAPGGEHASIQLQLQAVRAAAPGRTWVIYDRPDPWLRDWASQQTRLTDEFSFYRGYVFACEQR